MWQALIPIFGNMIDKIIPDPAQAADAKLKAMEMAQRGELAVMDAEMKLAVAQIEVNKVEAGTGLLRAGWRPALGWVCVLGLGYQLVLRPVLPWLVRVAGGEVPDLPSIDTDTLMVLLTGMLGLGGLRTFEKIKGRA